MVFGARLLQIPIVRARRGTIYCYHSSLEILTKGHCLKNVMLSTWSQHESCIRKRVKTIIPPVADPVGARGPWPPGPVKLSQKGWPPKAAS